MQFKYHLNIHPGPVKLLVLFSVFITLIFNFPFFLRVYNAISPSTVWTWLFMLSVPCVLICLNIIFLSLAGALFFPRIVVGFSVLISSLLFYAVQEYGVIFDRSMIQNIVETNSGEAASYLSMSFFLFFVLLGLFPIFAIFNQDVKEAFTKRVFKLVKINMAAALFIFLIGSLMYKDYAAIGRNNHNLVKYIIPFAFYDSGYKYLRDTYFYPPLPYRILDRHPHFERKQRSNPATLVVVVGETARADRFSINGYTQPTTTRLSQMGAVSFANVTSCGTATAVSVPCMFSRLSRENYDSRIASSQDNVLDIIHRAGASVTWIDNNSSCKGVCARIQTIDYDPKRSESLCDGDYCYDEILIEELAKQLRAEASRNRVIVLHMIGSHGPTYYLRYPAEFKKFTPDCARSDIQNCALNELNNTYDNTIVYTDYVLAEIITLLKRIPDASMLYVSDHGESLGEKGLFLHGFPYHFAPTEQTHVPMVYWDSKLNQADYRQCVTGQLNKAYSQDNVFDTLLGLARVNSTTYQPLQDVFQPCRS